jgi:hypothetical protein
MQASNRRNDQTAHISLQFLSMSKSTEGKKSSTAPFPWRAAKPRLRPSRRCRRSVERYLGPPTKTRKRKMHQNTKILHITVALPLFPWQPAQTTSNKKTPQNPPPPPPKTPTQRNHPRIHNTIPNNHTQHPTKHMKKKPAITAGFRFFRDYCEAYSGSTRTAPLSAEEANWA